MIVSNSALLLRLLLAPLLIVAAASITRRWGPQAAGLFAGLPLTSGPISLLVFEEHGPAFAAAAAHSVLLGIQGVVTFCWSYARAAVITSMPSALLAAGAAYATTVGVVFWLSSFGTVPTAVLATLTIILALRFTPRIGAGEQPRSSEPSSTLLLRTALAVVTVNIVAAIGAKLGPIFAGIASPFPAFAAIMACTVHRQQGPHAAIEFIRGTLRSTYAFVSFFLALALLLEPLHATAYFIATLVALLVQVIPCAARRLRVAAPRLTRDP